MADNSAAKVAAARKMLKDFQSKKKSEPVAGDELSLGHNTSEIINSNETQNEEFGIQSSLQHKNSFNSGSDVDINRVYTNMDQSNLNQFTASNFFDKLSSDNSVSQNQNDNSNNPIADNGIPLAGVLFDSENISQTNFVKQVVEQKSVFPGNHMNDEMNQSNKDSSISDSLSSRIIETGNDVRTQLEISKLQQQLQFHIKTVEFLVSEKSELLEKMNEYEKSISAFKSQSEDLGGRLNMSRSRASHLEMECNTLKQKIQESEARIAQLNHENSSMKATEHMIKTQLKDCQEELVELKSLVEEKVTENKGLSKKIEEMNFQLNSNPLRFHQEQLDNSMTEKCKNLQEQVESLQQQLSDLDMDKNQSNLQFQEYARELNNQVNSMNKKQADLAEENERLADREIYLIKQMSTLEKQMQHMHSLIYKDEEKIADEKGTSPGINLQTILTENEKLKVDLSNSESSLRTTVEELNQCQIQIEELSQTIQQVQAERPDSAKLNAAMESDKLAAQKATSQNTKMKLDLQHLEKAFELMTNSKLELAELLQAEKNLSKTLTLKLVETEEILKETRSKLHAKDEEMIRLQAASSDLQKVILKQAQIKDRLDHYEVLDRSSELLQSELQTTKHIVQTLSDENEKLKKNLPIAGTLENHSECNHKSEKHDHVTDEYFVKLPTADAMSKLEERFTKLMKEVADLSDEKQKLEHIVLQLQGETETICEYIALYQKQRSVLNQREIERNAQINILSKERETIKAQLDNLRSLITEFVPPSILVSENNSASDKIQTAEKIMLLLSQIKGSHLIEPGENCIGLENFNPCPCCSGKLINV